VYFGEAADFPVYSLSSVSGDPSHYFGDDHGHYIFIIRACQVFSTDNILHFFAK
jgi:hypothetical protein